MEDELARGAVATELEELASSEPVERKNVMTHSTIASATAREIRKTNPLKMQASKDMTKFLILRVVAVPFPLNTGDSGTPYRQFSAPSVPWRIDHEQAAPDFDLRVS